MSLEQPYKPTGHCRDCKFSSVIPKDHWQKQYHMLFCHRVPPTPATTRNDIWSSLPCVQLHSFCAMFEPVEPEKPVLVALDPEFFSVSPYHECEDSPVGQCVYTQGDRDCCIFCNQPEERK